MVGTPDYINRIAGVRTWLVAPNLWAQLGGLLWAPMMRDPWTTGEEYAATCTGHPDHTPPEDGCGCGIYAFLDPTLARRMGYWTERGAGPSNRIVAGVIGAAGKVSLTDRGLLAACATVEAIFTDGAPDDELPIPRAEIAQAYGADVIDTADYEEFCAERGLILFGPDDL
jgi:hypothetical protein